MARSKRKPKRTRRKHSDEFKREAVKLVTEEGYSVSEAAQNLDVNVSLLGSWKKKLELEEETITEDERMEMARLRTENRQLRMEREILKKAAAFFANEKS